MRGPYKCPGVNTPLLASIIRCSASCVLKEEKEMKQRTKVLSRTDGTSDPFRAFVLRWFANIGLALTALRFIGEQVKALVATFTP